MNDSDLELVSAYIDGELDEAEVAYLENRVRQGDKELELEIAELRRASLEFRANFREELKDSPAVDVWAAVSGAIKKERLEPSIFSKIKAVVFPDDFSIGAMFQPQMLAVAVSFLALGIVLMRDGQGGANLEVARDVDSASNPTRVASNAVDASPGVVESGVVESPLVFTSSENQAAVPLRQPLRFDEAVHSGQYVVVDMEQLRRTPRSQHAFPVRLQMPHVTRPQSQRAVRAGEVDIDWVRSDKAFQIVPAKRRAAAPIIWVAER